MGGHGGGANLNSGFLLATFLFFYFVPTGGASRSDTI